MCPRALIVRPRTSYLELPHSVKKGRPSSLPSPAARRDFRDAHVARPMCVVHIKIGCSFALVPGHDGDYDARTRAFRRAALGPRTTVPLLLISARTTHEEPSHACRRTKSACTRETVLARLPIVLLRERLCSPMHEAIPRPSLAAPSPTLVPACPPSFPSPFSVSPPRFSSSSRGENEKERGEKKRP